MILLLSLPHTPQYPVPRDFTEGVQGGEGEDEDEEEGQLARHPLGR